MELDGLKNPNDLLLEKRLQQNINEWFMPSKAIIKEYIAPQALINAKRVTFQAAMKRIVFIGQCFGLNPVLGYYNRDVEKQRFTYFSWRCLYTICSIVGQCVVVCFSMMNLFKGGESSLSSSTSLVFYITNLTTTILFLRIAKKWPKLSRHISETEKVHPNTDYGLIRRCNLSALIVLTLALLEHVLADLSGITLAIDCQPDTELYEGFILQSFPWVWTYVTYSPINGILMQFLNIQCTFNWNFADLFVICISWYLTSRLDQVNKIINDFKGQIVPPSFWRMMREDYTRATDLVKEIDDIISGVVFISFANNLFFICLQLLHTLEDGIKPTPMCRNTLDERPLKGYEQTVYFVYSFAFLLGRSMAVSLIASKVHTASREPAYVLYCVPSPCYCIEVQRFLNQIHGDTVALSGLQFFNVKRGLVLTVAGTIVTYELVLMQFAGVTPTPSPSSSPTLMVS